MIKISYPTNIKDLYAECFRIDNPDTSDELYSVITDAFASNETSYFIARNCVFFRDAVLLEYCICKALEELQSFCYDWGLYDSKDLAMRDEMMENVLNELDDERQIMSTRAVMSCMDILNALYGSDPADERLDFDLPERLSEMVTDSITKEEYEKEYETFMERRPTWMNTLENLYRTKKEIEERRRMTKLEKSVRAHLRAYMPDLKAARYWPAGRTGILPKGFHGYISTADADVKDGLCIDITIYTVGEAELRAHYYMEDGVVCITAAVCEFLESDSRSCDSLVANICAAIMKKPEPAVECVGEMIPLTQYAQMHGKSAVSVRQRAQRGGFRTAVKLGRDWIIREDEPYGDLRLAGERRPYGD